VLSGLKHQQLAVRLKPMINVAAPAPFPFPPLSGCLQLRFLRSQVGLVSQEPTLFATTIAENIRFGKPGKHPFPSTPLAALPCCHTARNRCSPRCTLAWQPAGWVPLAEVSCFCRPWAALVLPSPSAGCTQEEIIEAAKASNAHNFIMRLPKG
jgi:ABC-type multidrug transport system fused ATPase/permease subunit